MGTNRYIYKYVPILIIMVYHEIRVVKGKKQNYLVYNRRKNGKWLKKSRFIGTGNIPQQEIKRLKEEFEIKAIASYQFDYLSKEQILEIEKLKQEYNKKISSLTKEEFEQFETSFFTELTYNSNAIEGSSLSLQETSLVINENLVPEGKTLREIYEAKNHRKALDFIKEYSGELSEEFILKLHAIVLRDISERFAGRYRETTVRIFGSDVKFPDSAVVPQLVKNLVYWYNKNKKRYHPFEMAAIFSMKLVSIHPFVDGNGRISRLVMNFILKKRRYPWINIYNKQRAEYLKAVRKANNEEYKEILSFLIKSLKENLKDLGITTDL